MPRKYIKKTRNRRQKQRRPVKGGVLIAQGAYGCGFANPGIRCRGAPPPSADTFSKVMYADSATEEYARASLIRAIDPSQKYSVYPAEPPCDIDDSEMTPTNQMFEKVMVNGKPVIKCVPIREYVKETGNKFHPDVFRILQLENAGNTIDRFATIKREQIVPLFKSLLNLFDGLVAYHRANFYHLDIKTANIIIKELPSGEFRTRFIDFGLSEQLPDEQSYRTPPSYPLLVNSNYFAWPYDLRFIDPTYNPTLEKYGVFVEKAIAPAHFSSSPRRYMPDSWLMSLTGNHAKSVREYKDMVARLQMIATSEYDRATYLFEKADMYSFGLALANIYVYATKQHMTITGGEFLGADGITRNVTADPFQMKIYDELTGPFFDLVLLMSDPDCFNRIRIEFAREEYVRWLRRLGRFMDANYDDIPPLADFFKEPDRSPSPSPVAPPRPALNATRRRIKFGQIPAPGQYRLPPLLPLPTNASGTTLPPLLSAAATAATANPLAQTRRPY